MRDLGRLDDAWLRAKPGRKWRQHAAASPPDAPHGHLAAWVADMDHPPADEILDALRAVIDGGDLGYPTWSTGEGGSPAADAWVAWVARRHGWAPPRAEVREWSDIVQAIQTVLHLCTRPGDRVAVHVPAYPPFFAAIRATGCELLPLPAHLGSDARWAWDHEALDEALARTPARVLLLCNPHNPTGRCMTRGELAALLDVAERHDLLVVSDEIHAELVHDPHRHVPFASLPGAAARTVTLASASKAFNLAGLRYAVSHVGPAWVRERLATMPDHLLGEPNVMGAAAARAAWTAGEPWLAAMRAHLRTMRDLGCELVAERLPGVQVATPEATYLLWLECRGARGVDGAPLGDDPSTAFARRGVAVNPGPDFGPGGEGCVRLNVATTADVLRRVVDAMASALSAPGAATSSTSR